jgi:hypothetical protein
VREKFPDPSVIPVATILPDAFLIVMRVLASAVPVSVGVESTELYGLIVSPANVESIGVGGAILSIDIVVLVEGLVFPAASIRVTEYTYGPSGRGDDGVKL